MKKKKTETYQQHPYKLPGTHNIELEDTRSLSYKIRHLGWSKLKCDSKITKSINPSFRMVFDHSNSQIFFVINEQNSSKLSNISKFPKYSLVHANNRSKLLTYQNKYVKNDDHMKFWKSRWFYHDIPTNCRSFYSRGVRLYSLSQTPNIWSGFWQKNCITFSDWLSSCCYCFCLEATSKQNANRH